MEMAAQANSTSSLIKPIERFDLVSECSRFSPISRLSEEDEKVEEITVKEANLQRDGRHSERRQGSGRSAIPKTLFGIKESAAMDDYYEVNDADGQPHYEIPIWICGEPRFISGISCATTCRDIIQALIDDELHGNSEDENEEEEEEEEDEEDDGERKANWNVGVVGNSKKARRQVDINDDEFDDDVERASRRRYPQSGECNINIDRCRKDFTAASRDLNDYVITERWRDVEQPLSGNTKILSIWTAWGSARNEVRFRLKINKSKAGQHELGLTSVDALATKNKDKRSSNKKQTFRALSKMMHRLVKQSEYIQQHLARISDKPKSCNRATSATDLKHLLDNNSSGKTLLMRQFLQNTNTASKKSMEPYALEPIYVRHHHQNGQPMEPININLTDDELFLLIDDRQAKRSTYTSDDQDSGVHVEYRQYVLNKKINDNMSARLMQLAETPKRKLKTKNDLDRLRARSLVKSCATASTPTSYRQVYRPLSPGFDDANPELRDRHEIIRLEVAERLVEMNRLLKYEADLEQSLRDRSKQYQTQNQRYTLQNGLTASIDRIQAKLDAYTKEIVSNEFELFQIRLEISQKCGILHNLRRMMTNNIDPLKINRGSDQRASQVMVIDRIHDEHVQQQLKAQQELHHGRKSVATDENEQYVDVTFVDNIYEFCDKNKSIVV